MYGIYANIWGILMANVTIYTIHGSYGYYPNTESQYLKTIQFVVKSLHNFGYIYDKA